jgi:hypothetical protein
LYCLSFKYGGSLYLFASEKSLPTLWTFVIGYFGTFNFINNLRKMKGDKGMKKELWISTGVSAQG